MNCPTGKPGTPAYAMSAEESLSNMARLSLCGKLNLAIEKCNLYPFLIPYYGSKEFMTETALMHQIIQPFSASQYVPLYHKLGGNGMVTKMKQEIEELHIKRKGE